MKWTLKDAEKFRELSTRISSVFDEDLMKKIGHRFRVITVGDYTSEKYKDVAWLRVYDGTTRRGQSGFASILPTGMTDLRVCNEAGTVSDDAFTAVADAIGATYDGVTGKVDMGVDGEEDLLVLPCVLFAKDTTFVLYGDPFDHCTRYIGVDARTRKAVLEMMATCGVWE